MRTPLRDNSIWWLVTHHFILIIKVSTAHFLSNTVPYILSQLHIIFCQHYIYTEKQFSSQVLLIVLFHFCAQPYLAVSWQSLGVGENLHKGHAHPSLYIRLKYLFLERLKRPAYTYRLETDVNLFLESSTFCLYERDFYDRVHALQAQYIYTQFLMDS